MLLGNRTLTSKVTWAAAVWFLTHCATAQQEVHVQCWIEMVRKDTYIWFLISGEASSLSPLGRMLAVGFLWMPFIRLMIFKSSLCWLCLFVFWFDLVLVLGPRPQHADFLGQGLKPCHICNPSHSSDNVRSLTSWAAGELLLRGFYHEAPLDIVKWFFSFHWDNLLLFCPLFC